MKRQIFRLFLLSCFLVTILVSCKKNEEPAAENYDDEVAVQADDQHNFTAQLDAVSNDANIIMELNPSLSGRVTDVTPLVCGATYEIDTSGNPRTLTITYDGANCSGDYSRTGTVMISIPADDRWKDTGVVATASYQDLVVTRIADNKTITINGSHTITNVSGGLLSNLAALDSIRHRIASNGMSVKFGDDTQRTWEVARQRVFIYDAGIVIKVTGTRTDGSNTNIAEWGTNRFGRPFISAITEPLVFREDCNFRLVSGRVRHTLPVFSATATFGLNSGGEPTSCPGTGAYYVKIEWTGPANNSQSVILPY